jgi:hypothetical protein
MAAAAAIRTGKRAPGVETLFSPGEPEWRRREAAGGVVHLEPAIVAMLTAYADELGVNPTPFAPMMRENSHA